MIHKHKQSAPLSFIVFLFTCTWVSLSGFVLMSGVRAEDDIRSHGAGDAGSSELLDVSGSLKKHQAPVDTEPSLSSS